LLSQGDVHLGITAARARSDVSQIKRIAVFVPLAVFTLETENDPGRFPDIGVDRLKTPGEFIKRDRLGKSEVEILREPSRTVLL
jgi:hypothetical protein